MRVAVIAEVFLPKVDGVVNRTMHLIRQLLQRQDDVLVVCPRSLGGIGSAARPPGKEVSNRSPDIFSCPPIPVVEVPSFAFPLYPEYRIAQPDEQVVAALRDFRPDVVHFTNPFAFGFRCYDLLHRKRYLVPCVFSFHTLYGEFVKEYPLMRPLSALLWWLMREYHNRADMNLTVSRVTQQDLTQRGFQRVQFWPPAVDARLFHPGQKSLPMRNRLSNGQPGKPLLLTVSRLAPEKNVAFLADLLDQLPGVALAIVGDGPQRQELEQRFAGKPACFIGYLKGALLAQAYASVDAFVYASETETMGNVVLEAMACGCPIIAPRAGGIPSLINEGKTGLLFKPRNLDDALSAVRVALDNAELRTRLGKAARSAVEAWDWEHSIESVRQVYQAAIQAFRPTASRGTPGQRIARLTTHALVRGFWTFSKDRGTAKPKREYRSLGGRAAYKGVHTIPG
jgi:glycosyltransferase involved in cell wall biosynthesis